MGPARFSIDIKDLKDLKRHLLTMEIAGDRPPRYGHIETRRSLLPNASLASRLRKNQDREVSPIKGKWREREFPPADNKP